MERCEKYEQFRKLAMSADTQVRVIESNRTGWLFGYSWTGKPEDEYRFCVRFTPYGLRTFSINNHIETFIDGRYVTVERSYFNVDELELVE